MDFAQYGLADTDIQFLKKKLDEGNLVSVTGNRTIIGEIVAVTPPNGKIFYHLKSTITVTGGQSAGAVNTSRISVKNNITVMDTIGGSNAEHQSYQVGNSQGGVPSRNESTIPDKLVGDGVKKYSLYLDEITSGETVYGTIIGYYEDN